MPVITFMQHFKQRISKQPPNHWLLGCRNKNFITIFVITACDGFPFFRGQKKPFCFSFCFFYCQCVKSLWNSIQMFILITSFILSSYQINKIISYILRTLYLLPMRIIPARCPFRTRRSSVCIFDAGTSISRWNVNVNLYTPSTASMLARTPMISVPSLICV